MEVEEGRNPEEDQFRRLAAALGEPLAAVWSMPEQERRQLIQLLLEGGEQPAEQTKAAAGQPGIAAHQHIQQEQLLAAKSPGVTAARGGGEDCPAGPDAARTNIVQHAPTWSNKLESPLDLGDGAAVQPRMMELRRDAWKVMRMLQGTRNEGMEREEVVAYLEAHWLDPRRVEVVVDELSGVAEEQEEEQVTLAEAAEVVVKGKGQGKTSDRVEVAGVKRRLVEQPAQGGKVARTTEQEGRVADDLIIDITDSPVMVSPAFNPGAELVSNTNLAQKLKLVRAFFSSSKRSF